MVRGSRPPIASGCWSGSSAWTATAAERPAEADSGSRSCARSPSRTAASLRWGGVHRVDSARRYGSPLREESIDRIPLLGDLPEDQLASLASWLDEEGTKAGHGVTQ